MRSRETGTSQRSAAAASSIARAVAPTWRSGMKNAAVEVEPPVPIIPNPGLL